MPITDSAVTILVASSDLPQAPSDGRAPTQLRLTQTDHCAAVQVLSASTYTRPTAQSNSLL